MDGKYTVKEVEERTGVPASSLRQWERRYGFPKPERSDSGYRYFSDGDVAAISRMRDLVSEGVSPSRAAEMVAEAGSSTTAGPRSESDLAADLAQALVALDAARAEETLGVAGALYSLDALLLDVMRPALVQIGDLWHAGAISVATEHFASNYLQGRLRGLLRAMPGAAGGPLIVVACAPGEQHEIGGLILAVLLKRSGFGVVYLGANTPISDLAGLVTEHRADAVMMSITTREPLGQLRAARAHLESLPALLVLGGRTLEQSPELAAELGGVFLGNDARKVVPELRALLSKRR